MWINDHIPVISEMPHGGYKASGIGKDMSAYSFRRVHPGQTRHVGSLRSRARTGTTSSSPAGPREASITTRAS
jgi:acyl-CoA reductase-like NAD-dependent aldehyde dehydrogenase